MTIDHRSTLGALVVSGMLLATGLMAATPSVVQEKDSQINGGKTISIPFTSTNTPGNLVVAFVIWSNAGTVSISDSKGNAYVGATSPTVW